jgi:hypothetical protein
MDKIGNDSRASYRIQRICYRMMATSILGDIRIYIMKVKIDKKILKLIIR